MVRSMHWVMLRFVLALPLVQLSGKELNAINKNIAPDLLKKNTFEDGEHTTGTFVFL